MTTEKEGVITVYKDKDLVGLIVRDKVTGHQLVYTTELAGAEDIVEFIEGSRPKNENKTP